MARDEEDYESEETETESKETTSYEMIREFEKNRRDIALRDIGRIKENNENIMKIVQIQLTKALMDVTQTGESIQKEVTAFWMKELPIQNMILNYLSNVQLLITLYKQMEDSYKRHYAELYTTIDYPEFIKIQESYEQQIAQLFSQTQIMKEEVEKLKYDLEAEFDEKVKEGAIKEKNKLHTEYDQIMTEAEIEMDKIKAENKALSDENSTLKSALEKAKKNMPSEPIDITYSPKEEVAEEIKDLRDKSKDVLDSPKMPISGKYEVHEPSALVETKEGFTLTLTKEQLSDPQIKRMIEKVTPISETLGLFRNPTKKDQIFKDIAEMVLAKKTYNEIQRAMALKYSSATFYKYFHMMIDEKAIVREGTGPDSRVTLYPSKLREEKKDAKD